ncbi:protein TSSC4 [Mastacembelus armatus]|uniref:protein TSSC4 n=1 Tax=Mastacembelus armatus TaxID=205130 RepID=UPI000E456E4F|nr:protein TSSC4 [Mastacembelus armatus]XP_026148795.1 protein TSSC4 [Mastacembelus armatus]XP_026148796.1 protein TSSC4 [Mastacembelus armatus]
MCDQRNDRDEDVDDLSATDDSEPEEQPGRAPFDPELDRDDDDDDDDNDDDDDREVKVSAPSATTSFSLKGGSSAFSDRSHSIFDCLDSVTQQTSSSLKRDHATHGEFVHPQPPCPSKKASQPPSTSPPPPKKRGIPDYLVHPERWTHYSLEDVADTSDQENKRVAHQFLCSLQQERNTDSSCDIQQRMIFCRPNRVLKEQTADQLLTVRGKERGMHLSHLEEEGDDKEEEKKKKEEEDEDEDEDDCGEGSDKEMAGGRKDQSEEATEEREREEEKDTRRAVGEPEEENQKKSGEEKKIEEASPGFISFRKTKAKNYRRSSEKEDN